MIDYLKNLLLRFFILLLNVIKNLKVIIQKKPILGVMLLVFLLNNIFINHTLFTQHLGNNSQKNDYIYRLNLVNRIKTNNTSIPIIPEKHISKHEIFMKYFPDWKARMDYQKSQIAPYKSAIAKINAANRLRLKCKLTKSEKSAYEYFEGLNFYAKYQMVKTPPNIFDTRLSFILKMKNDPVMRDKFLESYRKLNK